MALRQIVKIGDEILRKKSRPIEVFDERVHQLLDDMKETLSQADGVGLAAVQVGVLKRIIIIDIDGLIEMINPVILHSSGKDVCREGCLSIPGKNAVIERPKKVKVKAFDRFGVQFTFSATEYKARAVCHEIDHLNGVLYVDRIDPVLQNIEEEEDED